MFSSLFPLLLLPLSDTQFCFFWPYTCPFVFLQTQYQSLSSGKKERWIWTFRFLKEQQSNKAAGIVKTYLMTEFFRELCEIKKEKKITWCYSSLWDLIFVLNWEILFLKEQCIDLLNPWFKSSFLKLKCKWHLFFVT